MSKLILLLPFIFVLCQYGHTSNITFLVDYNLSQTNIDDFKSDYAFLFKKQSLSFKRLGVDNKLDYDYKTKDFNFKSLNQTPSCYYDQCRELKNFYARSSFDRVYIIRGEGLCLKVNNNTNLIPISKLKKNDLKNDLNILIIDMRGYVADPPPKLILQTNSLKVSKGSSVNVIASLEFEKDTYIEGNMQWSKNGVIIPDSKGSILSTSVMENSSIKCVWESEDGTCMVESELTIESIDCDDKIPFSLNFDLLDAFERDKKDPNLIYIYPLQLGTGKDHGEYYVLFVKQNCIFNEFTIRLDSCGKKINEVSYNLLSIDDNYKVTQRELFEDRLREFRYNKELTPIVFKIENDTLKSKQLSLFIIPQDIEVFEKYLPKVEVFFTFCNPNDY